MKEFLISIPGVIWSGVVGALIALFATWLQNRAHLRRQREQLIHDAEQRRLDREMTMRREVYLAAAEAAAKLQEYLGSFSRTDISQEHHQAILADSAGALNRVYLIGEFETLKAFKNIQESFSISSLNLLEKKITVAYATTKVSEVESRIQELVQRKDQIIVTIQAVTQAKQENFLGTLISQFQKAEEEIETEQGLLEEAHRDLQNHQINLLKEALRAGIELATRLADATVLVRRELGFSLEEEQYKKMIAENSETIQKHYNDFITRLAEQYANTE